MNEPNEENLWSTLPVHHYTGVVKKRSTLKELALTVSAVAMWSTIVIFLAVVAYTWVAQ
jgi:hypothetical protein